MENYKLHVKIGNAEFNAEGPEATIKEQFQTFINTISATTAVGPQTKGHTTLQEPPIPFLPSVQEQNPSDFELPFLSSYQSTIDKSILDRVFSKDQNGIISLRIRPTGNERVPEALLMILYGYRVLCNEEEVLSNRLLEAMRQTGLPITRVDRAIVSKTDVVTKGGFRRGGKYGLNNPGIAEAEGLVNGLLK